MVVTLYIFDPQRKVRRILRDGIVELIHKEQDYELTAEIPVSTQVAPGEYLGMMCVDGRYRLFAVSKTIITDDEGTVTCTATDVAVQELQNTVVVDKTRMDATARECATLLLDGTAWSLGSVTDNADQQNVSAYYTSLWEALSAMETLYKVRVIPYYTMDAQGIRDRRVDVVEDTPVYRGRLFEPERDASSILVTCTGEPVTVLYAVGDEIEGQTDVRVTLADAAWSKAAGDPADKPAGQTWLADEDAVAKYGRRERAFVVSGVTDPAELIQKTWEELKQVKEPSVNVTATVADLEMAAGMSHKMVRLGDECIVRTRHAGDVRSRIIKINRDYVNPHHTKLELGDEVQTISSTVSSLSRSAIKTTRTLTKYQNEFLHDQNLIQLNAEAIQLNAKDILAQAETIRLHGGRLDEQGNWIQSASITIDGLESKIELKVDKAGIVSAINMSPEEITIQSKKVNLVGYVTASQLEAQSAKIDNLTNGITIANAIQTKGLVATTANISTLNSYRIAWTTVTIDGTEQRILIGM